MKLLNNALFLLFPTVCGMCGKVDKQAICKDCYLKIQEKNNLIIVDYSKQDFKYFDEHAYIFIYEGIIRKKILQYKFSDKAYLTDMFCEFFIKNEKVCRLLKKYDIIVPVPISKKRLKQRGYNQSSLIAKKLSINCNILYKNVLIKSKNNLPQSSLNKMQRVENVKGVYKLQNEQTIKDKSILIIDDIFTTGSTVNECAKLLKQARSAKSGSFDHY